MALFIDALHCETGCNLPDAKIAQTQQGSFIKQTFHSVEILSKNALMTNFCDFNRQQKKTNKPDAHVSYRAILLVDSVNTNHQLDLQVGRNTSVARASI